VRPTKGENAQRQLARAETSGDGNPKAKGAVTMSTHQDLSQLQSIVRGAVEETLREIAKSGFAPRPPSPWMNLEQASHYLGWAVGTWYQRRSRGEPLPRTYGTGKSERCHVEDADAFIRGGANVKRPTGEPPP
jgi:hypothetical protein